LSVFTVSVFTVSVFIVFGIVFGIAFLKEKLAWNYAVSFLLLIAAVVVAFAFRPSTGAG